MLFSKDDFNRHFEKTSKQIDRVHKMMPVFMGLYIVILIMFIIGLGLGIYWLVTNVL
jgi:hypothetical protein